MFRAAERIKWASLVAQNVKRLPAMQETWVQALSRKDPLEKEMATHSSILAWRIPWTEEPGGLQSTGSQRMSDFTLTTFALRVWSSGLSKWEPSFPLPKLITVSVSPGRVIPSPKFRGLKQTPAS